MDNEYYKRYEPFFGSWHIKRFIGAGSYGKVFEIERRDFDMVFTGALKAITIPADKSEYEQVLEAGMDREGASTYFRDYVQELNREIALMSRLKGHSNIVSYEDHQIIPHEDGIGWDILIRMELLRPINDALRQNKSFTRAEVIRLGTDLCRALEVCGQYNIIHRDIKPANIFISDTGDYKLGDFGVARIASASTGASTRAGTVNYMAPEVFRGEKYTANVDIYSLGLVMYQLLNANRMPLYPPYPQPMSPAQRERAQAQRLSGAALPPPANADGRLAEIVLKACAPDPAQRYDSPAVMRQALEAILYTEGEARVIYPGGDAVPVPGTGGTADLQPAPAPAKNVPDEGTIRPVPARAPESPAQEPETADGGTIGAPVPGWNDAAPAQEPAGTVHLMAAPFQPEAAEQPAAAPEKDGTVRLMAAPAEAPAQEQAPAQPTEPETPAEEAAPAEALPEDETICIAAAEKAPEEPAPAPADDRTERIAVPATVPAAVPEEPEADRTTFLFEAQAEKRRQEQQAKREAEEAARRKAAEEKEAELARIRAEKRAAEQAAAEEAARKAEAEQAAAAQAAQQQETPAAPAAPQKKGSKLPLAIGGVAVAAVVAVGGFALAGRGNSQLPVAASSVSVSSSSVSSTASSKAASTAASSKTSSSTTASTSQNAADLIDSGSCGKNATWELYKDGTLYIKGTGAMTDYDFDYNTETKVTITNVPWYATHLSSIKKIVIESGITHVGAYSFMDCDAVTEIELPDTLTTIGENAFWMCDALKAIKIPSGVTEIGEWAFSGCLGLTEVELPEGLKTIGHMAFNDCGAETVTIPGSVKKIPSEAFWFAYAQNVVIEEGVEEIGEEAFYYNDQLKSVTIPRSVKKIDSNAFAECPSLKSVTISKNCNVASNAFPSTVQINYYD